MATLITLGTSTLNLDQVTEIVERGGGYRVFYAVGLYSEPDERQELAYSDYSGDEAEALRAWLWTHAERPSGTESEESHG
ncbi:MAG TPA: hypothetical protein VFU22_11650 [Roseiflexaceae bacterium]|nr:hypothetical protein [Roseiflexaceae bacterium]